MVNLCYDGDTEESLKKMYSKAINSLRSQLQLTPIQREILIGSILGDGYLFPTVSGKYAYLRISHGPKQKQYLFWKYSLFRDWVLPLPKYQFQNKNKPELGGYWWFKTIAHPVLLSIRKLFYPEGKKRIPHNIGEIMKSPRSLAVWYGDDGTLVSSAGLRIQSEGFTKPENELLLELLWKNFGVNCKLQRNGGNGYGWSIGIGKDGTEKFIKLIRPYLPKCLEYKFP